MAKKYLTEDNIKNILSGIKAKIPKELEVNINTNVNRVKVELLDSPVTLTINSWGAVNLNRPMTDFDEVEFEYRPKFGANTQFRKFSILNSSLLDMTSDGRCMDSFTMEAGVTNNVINQYVGIIMRIPSNDYQNPEFFTRFGGLLSSAYIELAAVRGINYTQSCGDTPLGTIISYMGITPPDEYLACDGTTYLINQYWELAEFIKSQFGSYNYFGGNGTTTFAVPDLRGEFLRGTGTNSHTNQGNGANVGEHQDGTVIPRVWYNGAKVQMDVDTTVTDLRQANEDYTLNTENGRNWVQAASQTGSNPNNVVSAYTSRPTNTSVLYCIKYTNSSSMQPSNVYSTEEKRIGTWIDGKPLYQITVHMTSPSTVNTGTSYGYDLSNIGLSISNLDLKSMEGFLIGPAPIYHRRSINFSFGHGTNDVATYFHDNAIYVTVSHTAYLNCDMYITLKYTKV